jgi:hypothetical protein
MIRSTFEDAQRTMGGFGRERNRRLEGRRIVIENLVDVGAMNVNEFG